jgi:hypothetical protein
MPPNTPEPPNALGNVVPLGNADTVPQGSPPSSYAAYALAEGERGALLRFAGLTVLRALLIAPGVALAGARGQKLILGSLAGSAVISVAALGYVFVSRKQAAQPAIQIGPLPTTAPPVPDDVIDAAGEPMPMPEPLPEPPPGVV